MKKIYIESFYTLVLVYAAMLLFPVLYNFDLLRSFKEALSDFNITDSVYSTMKVDKAELHSSDDNIVIVDIDGISKQGVAKLIDLISKKNPRVIGIDRVFEKGEKRIHDFFLTNSIESAGNVVLSSEMHFDDEDDLLCDSISTSDSLFLSYSDVGYINLGIGQDKKTSTIRDYFPRYKAMGDTLNSFAYAVAKKYDENSIRALSQRNNEKEIIFYRGNLSKFHFEDGIHIMNDEVFIDYFKDKIVLLGDVGRFRGYKLVEDLYFTPLNERYSGRTFPDMNRIEIQANIISRLIERKFVDEMPMWLSVFISVILCYINILVFSIISIKNKKWFEISSMLVFLAESLVIIGLTIWAYSTLNYQLRLNVALIAIAISVFAYQFYNESVKPFAILIYNKFIK
jgi:CHASE2 domain-containing sensor protein